MREAVIIEAVRTPFGKFRGGLRNVHPADLLGDLMRALVERTGIAPEQVDDVIAGCVGQAGEQATNVARNAWLSAGLPESVPATTIDRQCGSSLQAVQFAAQGVMAGTYDLVIAAGVESLTRVPIGSSASQGPGTPLTERIDQRYQLGGKYFDQAIGAEMIAQRWGLTRSDLDRYSFESHMRAAAARSEGFFDREIVPVRVQNPGEEATLVTADEGIRPNTSLERLAGLKPAFPGLDLTTAGNASQLTDGASAVLIASVETARKLGLKPRARLTSFAVVGADPVTMLLGPIPATQKVLQRAGLSIDAIDLFEVNEAFAPVVLAWQKETGVPRDRVNTNGGAIALGHPLGASGGRLVATLLGALEQRKGRYGLVTVCEGGGMANAAIIERIDG